MSYVTPRSWMTGDLITAAYLNQDVRDNVLYLKEHEVPTGGILDFGGITAPTGYLICDGSAVNRLTYSALFAALTKSTVGVTITIASPGVVTWTAHGLSNGMPVRLSTSGALPTGLSVSTTYYVINKAVDTFQLSATVGGSAINTSGSQSGAHSALVAPYGYGNGTTTFNVPDFRNSTTFGAGSTRVMGETGGAASVTLTSTELPAHLHSIGSHTHPVAANAYDTAGGTANSVAGGSSGGTPITVPNTAAGSGNTGSTGTGAAFSILNPYGVINKIIKT